jgi:RHH-type transcriptional regulator, rel operon repressor / antitoxin RelB
MYDKGASAMLAVRLDAELEARLDAAAKASGVSKSRFARQALQDNIERFEDIAAAVEALRTNDPSTNVSFEEVKRRFDMVD